MHSKARTVETLCCCDVCWGTGVAGSQKKRELLTYDPLTSLVDTAAG